MYLFRPLHYPEPPLFLWPEFKEFRLYVDYMGIMVPNSLLGTSALSDYLVFDLSLSKEVGIPEKAR